MLDSNLVLPPPMVFSLRDAPRNHLEHARAVCGNHAAGLNYPTAQAGRGQPITDTPPGCDSPRTLPDACARPSTQAPLAKFPLHMPQAN